MSNRQARREQSRGSRPQQQRPARPQRQPGASKRGGGSSNMPDFMSPGFLLIAGAVVIVLLGLAVFAATRGGGSDSETVKQLEAASANLPVELASGSKLGQDNAPVKMVEYADFQCPFCLRVTAEDMPTVIDEYVKTGKVQLEFKNYPILGQESVRAGRAAECMADQNKFWQFHDRLYLAQAQAGQLSNEKLNVGRFSDSNLRQYVTEVGGDAAAYDACMNDPASADKVAQDTRDASQLGVSGTPSFFLNGRPLGGTPSNLDAWRAVLDQVVSEAQASPTPAASPTGAASPAASPSGTASPAASPSASATTAR